MTVSKSPSEEQREQQRMQDILVLLQHLTENEETTIKLIIECLYDVGAVNFINKKIQNDSINQLTKTVAGMSKPLAKRYGYYWFKKNCPELIVNWLRRKVAFPPPKTQAKPPQEASPQPEPTPITTEPQAQISQSPQHHSQQQTANGNAPSPQATPSVAAIADTASPPKDMIHTEINTTVTALEPLQDLPPHETITADEVKAEPIRLVNENSVDSDSAHLPINDLPPVTTPETTESEVTVRPSLDPLGEATSAPSRVPVETSSANLLISDEGLGGPEGLEHPTLQPHPPAKNKVLMDAFKVTTLPTPLEQKTTQIRRLKTQNKILMGSLAGSLLVGGVAIWQLHATQQSALQSHPSKPSSAPAHQSIK